MTETTISAEEAITTEEEIITIGAEEAEDKLERLDTNRAFFYAPDFLSH